MPAEPAADDGRQAQRIPGKAVRDPARFYADVANSLDEYSIAHRQINVPQNGSMSVAEIAERIGSDWLYEEIVNTECGEIQV
jgi:hypothetical protein